jgi:hypothetical protein
MSARKLRYVAVQAVGMGLLSPAKVWGGADAGLVVAEHGVGDQAAS